MVTKKTNKKLRSMGRDTQVPTIKRTGEIPDIKIQYVVVDKGDEDIYIADGYKTLREAKSLMTQLSHPEKCEIRKVIYSIK